MVPSGDLVVPSGRSSLAVSSDEGPLGTTRSHALDYERLPRLSTEGYGNELPVALKC